MKFRWKREYLEVNKMNGWAGPIPVIFPAEGGMRESSKTPYYPIADDGSMQVPDHHEASIKALQDIGPAIVERIS